MALIVKEGVDCMFRSQVSITNIDHKFERNPTHNTPVVDSWRLIEAPGTSWHLLTTLGGSWRLLALPGGSWLLLAIVDGSSRLLAVLAGRGG